MLFRAFDTSQDGLLELPEIIVGMVKLTSDDKDVKEETKLEMIFDAYDDDHSGTLEIHELIKLLTGEPPLPFPLPLPLPLCPRVFFSLSPSCIPCRGVRVRVRARALPLSLSCIPCRGPVAAPRRLPL